MIQAEATRGGTAPRRRAGISLEQADLEQLIAVHHARVGSEGVLAVNLRTLESLLLARPAFELRVSLTSSEPLSRSLLSSVGVGFSPPVPSAHGRDACLRGGAVHRPQGPEVAAALQDIEAGRGRAGLRLGTTVGATSSSRPSGDPAAARLPPGPVRLEAETPIQETFLLSELSQMMYQLFDPRWQGIVGLRFETYLR